MICPSWTQTRTQPVHIDDVMEASSEVSRSLIAPGTYDLGVQEPVSYVGILQKAADMMQLKLTPSDRSTFFCKTLQTVGLPRDQHPELVAPLIESLLESMLRETHRFRPSRAAESLESALGEAPSGACKRSSTYHSCSPAQVSPPIAFAPSSG